MKIDVNDTFVNACTFLRYQTKNIHIVLAGCGGTGSFLGPILARIAANESRHKIAMTLVDHDIVEIGNIERQNFQHPEVGLNKAECLAYRIMARYGLSVQTMPERFQPDAFYSYGSSVFTLFIGCVDNAAARKAICNAVAQINQHDMQAAWLDCGNRETDGQVVFGNAVALGDLQGAFKVRGRCTRLPVVFQLLPNLMTPLPEEQAGHALSCEDLALANRQGLIVNQMVATIAGGYVNNVLSNRLRTFKTSFDLTTMTMHSLPINPVRVAREIARAPGQLAYTPDIFIEPRAKPDGPFVRIH